MKNVILSLALALTLSAAVLGPLRGIVHDPTHRPVAGAEVVIRAAHSDYTQTLATSPDGAFETAGLPVGAYTVTVAHAGFATAAQQVMVTSTSAAVLHIQLAIGARTDSVTVEENALTGNPESMTPTTVVSRQQIQTTPGADLSNSLSMITDYVPGAWITHDQLHIRGGHQVTWAIDGVPIPNTNIASSVGPQIDPKNIDYLEAQRGGYSSELGDRTFGVFNVVPRTGFERSQQGELTTTFGSFRQTNDQVSLGSHTEKFAYFTSVNANRSDYGLETPGPPVLHDRVWGAGGAATLTYNRDASNQFRFYGSLRRDDYQVPNDPAALDAGVRDVEREHDAVASFSWAHTFAPGLLFTASPFFHDNANLYSGDPTEQPVATSQRRSSLYAGAQVSLAAVTARNNARLGIYAFGQHDDEAIQLTDASAALSEQHTATGHVDAFFLEDQYRVRPWLAITAGLRLTHFAGAVAENAATPRFGGSLRIPYLHWMLRAFWGQYYQAPPLSTVSGPLLIYAATQGLGFIPLHGERDQEHQFGLTIPLRGWSIDVNNYHQRARNYFDHNAIGNSNVFFPLTISNARFYGWEVAARSPQILHRGEIYLAYSYAHALGAGAISGGLTNFAAPDSGYFTLDHDQRHTLHTGFNLRLPRGLFSGGNIYYGSGFSDGNNPGAHLPGHTTFDISAGKALNERVTLSVTALNATNRRFLLDNSLTFGGQHYADPRQIYAQIRYAFKY